MSQFDFPRINFHGSALLDTPTANNGNYEPSLTIFNQDESTAFLPPRCYLPAQNNTYDPPAGVTPLTDAKGTYVPIAVITPDNYQEWATTPLGQFPDDKEYWSLYDYLSLTGSNPGYWNYYGDLSMSLMDTKVTGITLLQDSEVRTFTPENPVGCPAPMADMLDAVLSFNNNYFAPYSQTTAYLCDADSIGQMCTQIFCSQIGLYKTDQSGKQITFLNGKPVKSTARWMNLNKVLNYSDKSLTPMGGSACFYAMITENDGSGLAKMVEQFTGKLPTGLFLKLMIHEVYEVRNPDYASLQKMVVHGFSGDEISVPKNPARVAVSGSITPYFDSDMKTLSISRLMCSTTSLTIDGQKLPAPVTKNGNKLSIPQQVQLAPIQLFYNPQSDLLSLDLLNVISEYGNDPALIVPYAGDNDIPAFQRFESYDFGEFTLGLKPDDGSPIKPIGSFDYANNYSMQQLLATGGIVDLVAPKDIDFSKGQFKLTLSEAVIFSESDYFISSDQMGNYAQQNQATNEYMSDGLPRIPCTLRVFYRGQPVAEKDAVAATQQAINMRMGSIVNTSVNVFDGMQMNFPVDKDGCATYGIVDSNSMLLQNNFSNLFQYVANTSLIVCRTLSSDADLAPYLNGQLPITWEVVYHYVFSLFKVIYPVMDAIIPFEESNWSSPVILDKVIQLMDEKNWNQPLYMPITRDFSAAQHQLVKMWADQLLSPAAQQ